MRGCLFAIKLIRLDFGNLIDRVRIVTRRSDSTSASRVENDDRGSVEYLSFKILYGAHRASPCDDVQFNKQIRLGDQGRSLLLR